jgi:hypothetical protein
MRPQRFFYPSPGFSDYWQNGVGRNLLAKIEQTPSYQEIESYSKLLLETDTLADEIVRDVFEKIGYKEGHQLLNEILSNDRNTTKPFPPALQKLADELNQPPAWLNRELLEKGSSFCRRTGPFGFIVLRNYCLMGGYESSAINKSLIFTGALKKGAAKRMAETLEFWVNVTGENALAHNNIGFVSSVKVRMIHAFARAYIYKQPEWKNELWGMPLNKGDTVATNLGFSIVFLEGIRRMGFKPSEEEIKGLFHFWKYIGYLLGIPPEYLPDNEQEAIALLYKWTITQPTADEDTCVLAAALMNEPILASFPKHNWQKKALIKIHLGYNYYFLGNRACTTMKLPATLFKYLPYIAKLQNSTNEIITTRSNYFYTRAVKSGRKKQEKIKLLFMRGHGAALQAEKRL